MLAAREGFPALSVELLEPLRIDGARAVEPQPVAARLPCDRVLAEQPPQARHDDLQRVGGMGRQLVAPQRVDRDLRGQHAGAVDQEQREQPQRPSGAPEPGTIVSDRLDGPQDPELHQPSLKLHDSAVTARKLIVSAVSGRRKPLSLQAPALALEVRPLERGRAERSKLRRELRRLDTVFFLISAMVVVDTIGAIAIGGAQAFTWLLVLLLFFFVPSALASAELGAAIPEEGGAYAWVRTAFGRFAGAQTSILYWAGTPMWLGGSVTVVAIAVVERFLGGLGGTGAYVFGALFVAAATVGAVVPLRYGKWVPTSGAIGQILLLVVLHRHGGRVRHRSTACTASQSRSCRLRTARSSRSCRCCSTRSSASNCSRRRPRRWSTRGATSRPRSPAPVSCQALMYAIPILAVLVVLPADAGDVAARADRRDGDRLHRLRRNRRRRRRGRR